MSIFDTLTKPIKSVLTKTVNYGDLDSAPSAPPVATTTPVSQPNIITDPKRQLTFNRAEIDNVLKPVLFAEISNRPIESKKLEANVIMGTVLNRALERKQLDKRNDLAWILKEPNQYQGYNSKQYNAYINNKLDSLSQKKRDEINSLVDEMIKSIEDGTFEDVTGGAKYYVHDEKSGKIYFNNKKRYLAKE